MSKPIRYGLADADLGRIHIQADGHLVMWADYAALAAENANLKALQWETLKERNKPEAENERLRKAGDAMLGTYIHACAKGLVDQDTAHRVVSEWAKAKEGGAK